jgi:class 3 adenylate cyclase/tetratricopeptide (TPR) repeat protein
VTCAMCGTVAVLGARFCHHCGSALPDAAALPATERRVVTVVFGDLSEFTSWSEDLDPERVGAVLDRVMAALAGSVKTFGGHVDKLTGDGIMALFGAPVAHEDDAERAVRAALSMQRAVRRVLDDERGGGAPLGLRVGINTGVVVAGVQASLEYTVLGDTVNTAARLADSAAIGTVYAGARTAGATRHLASWRQLRPLRLKGKREPVDTYELLGLHDAPGTRTALGDEAPFVGREPELGRMASRLAEVVDRGVPRVLVFTAEAGVGLSRFAAEAARYAAEQNAKPARVLSVRCAAYGERRRMAPLADLVRAATGLPPVAAGAGAPGAGAAGAAAERGFAYDPVERPAAEQRLRRLGARLDRPLHTEALLSMLGFGEPPDPRAAPPDRVWPPGGPRTEDGLDPTAAPAAVAGLLSALASAEPLLVIVDDLHAATAETLAALGTTVSRLAGPVLVLLLGRPELVRANGAFVGIPDAEVTTLPALRGADAARLLSSYLGDGRLPEADEDRLLATAQGNPFYLAELVTLLMERGALTRAGRSPGEWRLAPGSLGARLLSRDLAAVLAARIDALPAEARSVLRDAAVVGETVPDSAVAALAERRPGRHGQPSAVAAVELERAVDELLHRLMLRRVRGGYAFPTPLMREAAYAGLGKADLAERHAYLARWAASGKAGLPEADRDAFVARHVERAAALAQLVGLAPDANPRLVVPLGVAALTAAARRSVAAGEPALAVEYAQRATRLAGRDLGPADQLIHARALLQSGRAAESRDLCEKILANAGDGAAVRAGALLIAGRAYRELGEPQRAVESWREALAVATGAGLTLERSQALRRLGMADFFAGQLAMAATRFGEAYEVAVAAGDRRQQGWALHQMAWVTTSRGDFAGADRVLGRAARLFAEQRDQFGRAWLRGTTAFARLLAGRLAEAQRLARIFLPFGERVGEAWAVGTLRAVWAFAAAELGELAEADRMARRAYRDFAAADDDWGRGFALMVRGVVARGLGEADHAADLLDDANGYCERAGHPLLIGMARTIRGLVALEAGDPDAALAQADAVLAVGEPHGLLEPAQVAPRLLLARAKLARSDHAAALAVLQPIVAAAGAPSVLVSRRQAVATYARALLAAGQPDEALSWARLANELPAEDIRSRVVGARVLARTLAAAGACAEARAAADEAVRLAYATEQVSERRTTDDLRAHIFGRS